jgi:hypothetical protein
MATVKEVLDFSKNVSREVRQQVYNYLDPLESHDRMIVNIQVARSLRRLAKELSPELEEYEPPVPSSREVSDE